MKGICNKILEFHVQAVLCVMTQPVISIKQTNINVSLFLNFLYNVFAPRDPVYCFKSS